ncbi:MAG TPA: PAS domain S-box protein [Verrucomicrobiae bacterium]|nr:PAS domain S-box protein [Verrucomicrobiae bacterium]
MTDLPINPQRTEEVAPGEAAAEAFIHACRAGSGVAGCDESTLRALAAVAGASLRSGSPADVAGFLSRTGFPPATSLRLLKSLRSVFLLATAGNPAVADFFDAVEVAAAAEWTVCESCTLFRGLFDGSPLGVAVVSEEWRFTRVNEEFSRLTGLSPESAAGRPLSEVFPEAEFRSLQSLAARGASTSMESRIRTSGGSLLWVQLAVSFPPGGAVLQVSDISDAKSTEEALALAIDDVTMQKAKVEAMIAAIGDGVSIQDTAFTIVYQNDALRRLTGDCVGRRCHEVYAHSGTVCDGCPLAASLAGDPVDVATRDEFPLQEGITAEVTTSLMRSPDGRVVGGIEIIRDVSSRKKMEIALSQLATGVSSSDGGSFFRGLVRTLGSALDADACFIGVDSGGGLEVVAAWGTGIGAEDFRYPLDGSPFDHPLLDGFTCHHRDLAARFPADRFLGEQRVESCLAMPMLDSRRRRIGVLAVLYRRPIDCASYAGSLVPVFASRAAGEIERMRTRRALLESERRYRSLFENAMEGMFRSTLEGRLTDVNPALALMLGFDSTEELLAMDLARELYAEPDRWEEMLRELEEAGAVEAFTTAVRKRNGELIIASIFARTSYTAAGEPLIEGIVLDITDKIEAERRVMRSLREKEVLLQEIHHRVKNNLQIVSGLLALQSMQIKNARAREILLESENRIASMAMIHDRLYNSCDLVAVDFAEYASNLVNHILVTHEVEPGRVDVHLDVEGIQLTVEQAIPCGLIINELVMNSLKHGLRRCDHGSIWVSLHRREEALLTLLVADDGRGFGEIPDFAAVESLGLRLVSILCSQLGGTISCTSGGRTEVAVTFPEQAQDKET